MSFFRRLSPGKFSQRRSRTGHISNSYSNFRQYGILTIFLDLRARRRSWVNNNNNINKDDEDANVTPSPSFTDDVVLSTAASTDGIFDAGCLFVCRTAIPSPATREGRTVGCHRRHRCRAFKTSSFEFRNMRIQYTRKETIFFNGVPLVFPPILPTPVLSVQT